MPGWPCSSSRTSSHASGSPTSSPRRRPTPRSASPFEQALDAEGLLEQALDRAETLERALGLDGQDEATPILLAVSDNGSQMIAGHTRKFMAMVAIAQHFGRPATPTDQAWIESLNGTVKAEWPHLNTITDPAVLRAELDDIRTEYNGSRLHSGIGYVTPLHEHEGRGATIRTARHEGLAKAARQRLAYHRDQRKNQPNPEDPDVV
ncbi:integrase core domain-containing protein [Ornithinimicrobium sp. Y1694]|uniref:integrase core domain-containing protein n=1 Tax=Ornithinimicrobium sp. Y1694 TaxID=3418590 RepID=UPI003CFBB9C2